MLGALLGLPGKLTDGTVETAVVGAALVREVSLFTVGVNRLGILRFAQARYPDLFQKLDGGDKRILRAFADVIPVSNFASLLFGGVFAPKSEFRLSPFAALRYASDAFGSEAAFDNSFIERDEDVAEHPERWFFINGIATSRDLARRNVQQLRRMFKHPFTLVHNPTQGLINDLVESVMQKFTNLNTEPVARAFLEIAGALLDDSVKRVAVIAHSQGTIVMGDVLDLIYLSIDERFFDRTNLTNEDLNEFKRASSGTVKAAELVATVTQLKARGEQVLNKLELYMFANAASRMCYTNPQQKIPHIESYANEHDIVARLGVLGRDALHEEDLLRIDGSLFTQNRYGHLLNAHYLTGFASDKYKLLDKTARQCIGSSVHDAVRGNPCRKHPKHHPGPTMSKLQEHYQNAQKCA